MPKLVFALILILNCRGVRAQQAIEPIAKDQGVNTSFGVDFGATISQAYQCYSLGGTVLFRNRHQVGLGITSPFFSYPFVYREEGAYLEYVLHLPKLHKSIIGLQWYAAMDYKQWRRHLQLNTGQHLTDHYQYLYYSLGYGFSLRFSPHLYFRAALGVQIITTQWWRTNGYMVNGVIEVFKGTVTNTIEDLEALEIKARVTWVIAR
jgi:hypothetical protein